MQIIAVPLGDKKNTNLEKLTSLMQLFQDPALCCRNDLNI